MKHFLDPMAIGWLVLLGFALANLLRRDPRRREIGIGLMCFAVAASIAALGELPARLVALLERPHHAAAVGRTMVAADSVVICGGGIDPSSGGVGGIEFNDAADRLLAALELARKGRVGEIVLGGGGHGESFDPVDERRAKEWLESLGVRDVKVDILGACLNTRHEAVRAAQMHRERGWARVCLVTSAWHMRRAAAAFRKAGVPVDVVAADFKALSALENNEQVYFYPRTADLDYLRIFLQETVGYLYYTLRGWA